MSRTRNRGFSLVDVLIAVVIVGILAMIAYPSYRAYAVRSSRLSAQSELIALANAQEKIFLNSNAYTTNVSGAYTGQATGGLGVTSGKTKDDRYSISISGSATTFTLTATPVAGTPQAGDGNLSITENGTRTWGSKTW